MRKIQLKKYVLYLLSFFFWIAVWEIAAIIVDFEMLLPKASVTFTALLKLFTNNEFYLSLSLSFLRITLGLIVGVIMGIAFAFACYYIKPFNYLFSPILKTVRATPVASVIMIIWMIFGSANVPWIIASLMVMPIIWQNLLDGFDSIDRSLVEVCDIYSLSFLKRMKILIIPSLKKYLIPAFITSAGLSWKSGIAAEIIAYTKNSIGRDISNAKAYFETDKMFALTIVVIVLSIIIEKILFLMKNKADN